MAQFEQIPYTLPDFWAPALINGDRTGMSDEDEQQYDAWLEANIEEMGEGHWGLDLEDQESVFRRYHDAFSVMACDCYEYVWNKRVS